MENYRNHSLWQRADRALDQADYCDNISTALLIRLISAQVKYEVETGEIAAATLTAQRLPHPDAYFPPPPPPPEDPTVVQARELAGLIARRREFVAMQSGDSPVFSRPDMAARALRRFDECIERTKRGDLSWIRNRTPEERAAILRQYGLEEELVEAPDPPVATWVAEAGRMAGPPTA